MCVHSGQDLVLVAEQLVQHQQGEGRRGRVCIDHDVFEGPVILGRKPTQQSECSYQVLFLHLMPMKEVLPLSYLTADEESWERGDLPTQPREGELGSELMPIPSPRTVGS